MKNGSFKSRRIEKSWENNSPPRFHKPVQQLAYMLLHLWAQGEPGAKSPRTLFLLRRLIAARDALIHKPKGSLWSIISTHGAQFCST